MKSRLRRRFYARNPLLVCQCLLGKTLVRRIDHQLIAGKIVEVEAYVGPEDEASHAYRNFRSPRTQIQYGKRGCSYVFIVYGMFHCFCVVVGPDHVPAVCLIRAVEPLLGLDLMRKNRKCATYRNLTNGPGRLCESFDIDKRHYGLDLCRSDTLFIGDGETVPASKIKSSRRIGVEYSGNSKRLPWRFYLENPFVSRP
jgi:DNA-3-methyladenine glycosylase